MVTEFFQAHISPFHTCTVLCTILFCTTTNNEEGDQGGLQAHLYCFSTQEEVLTCIRRGGTSCSSWGTNLSSQYTTHSNSGFIQSCMCGHKCLHYLPQTLPWQPHSPESGVWMEQTIVQTEFTVIKWECRQCVILRVTGDLISCNVYSNIHQGMGKCH